LEGLFRVAVEAEGEVELDKVVVRIRMALSRMFLAAE